MKQVMRLSEERVEASISIDGYTEDPRLSPAELWQIDC